MMDLFVYMNDNEVYVMFMNYVNVFNLNSLDGSMVRGVDIILFSDMLF